MDGRAGVSVVRYNDDRLNIRKAVALCGGLAGIPPGARVLIKPNFVMWDRVFPFPKYGVITTAVVLEELVRLLKEHGCSDIAIGEGAVEDKDIGSSSEAVFAGLGLDRLKDRYGLRLIDFNRGPFTAVDCGGFSLKVAAAALETDCLVNVPVLKTHNSTRVSLGFKNLKGCLAGASRMFCHHPEIPLDTFIQCIGEKLAPALTIIDGIYALDRGPAPNGTAFRTDLIIASRDMFAADVAGAAILGMDPAEVGHLAEHARRHSLSLDPAGLEIAGESLESVATPLKWDWGWLPDNSGPTAFGRLGISGLHYPKYDDTICSGCSYLNNLLLILLIGAYTGQPFPNIEFLSGKVARSAGGFDKTFLFGQCVVKVNRGNPAIREAVPIKGCPPRVEEIIAILHEHGINVSLDTYRQYRESLYDRYAGRPGFDEAHFRVAAPS